ncbi:threonine dehydratase biosynthetic chloroplastic [Prunus yedoensis var. nudiflora]|uniref:Threonine dehydratase biosynthetic chloroplastic n=1 Tax=Prunus yedoensis var. nudiflora TaxID=2094558 RepID=A0A314Y7S3_PRUYE|nr:threonine dehydratase biosynthetic chloroplastic [Prunus yedoensis var. nudiflora]
MWGKYGLDKLRVVTELANVGLQLEAILATIMPEEPRSVGVHTASELEEMQERLESSRLKTFNLTKSDLVKDHLRYLGETGANVLAGIQVARDKIDEFQARANSLGYDYVVVVTDDEEFNLLMHWDFHIVMKGKLVPPDHILMSREGRRCLICLIVYDCCTILF